MEWTEIGQMAGAAVAAFLASVVTAQARVEARLKQPAEKLDVVDHKIESLQKANDALIKKFEAIEARAVKFVTDEEFHAYVRTTTEAVNGLSEKVGRAAGAIEAWYNNQKK